MENEWSLDMAKKTNKQKNTKQTNNKRNKNVVEYCLATLDELKFPE